MSDILLIKDRILNTIELGESHFREFKSAWEGKPEKKIPRSVKAICTDIGEALVAFANADGGDLLIGVEDDKKITGIPHNEEDINKMLNAVKTHVHASSILPINFSEKIEIENNIILFFSVSKGTTDVFQLPDGRCVQRKDKNTIPAIADKIRFDRHEIRSREYDRIFVDGAVANDLDLGLIQNLADNYLKGLSPERYLQQMGLGEYTTGGIRLKNAALLLFARNISKWHPRSQVRILKVLGTELLSGERYNVKSDEIVTGNIFELLVRSWELLRPSLTSKTQFSSDAKFDQKYIYPESACREALVNAIAHRDYSIQNGIDVFIFDDRMEIKSPGALLSTITIEDLEKLKGAHESRNSNIARMLRENNLIRELGEGMRRIFELMQEYELQKPILITDTTSFTVSLFNHSVYNEKQLAWLALFEPFNLSHLQKRIVVFGMDDREISPGDIYSVLKTDDRNIYDTEVTHLRNANILVIIRSYQAASKIAKNKRISKAKVPRFKINYPLEPRERPDGIESERTVYVTNLNNEISENDLLKLFGTIGKIEIVTIPRDHITGQSRGYAFIRYYKKKFVDDASRNLNGVTIKGEKIQVMKYISQKNEDNHKNIPERTVQIRNLPLSITEKQIRETFEKCGDIDEISILSGDAENGLKIAFVQFSDMMSTWLAISKLNGQTIGDKKITVSKYMQK